MEDGRDEKEKFGVKKCKKMGDQRGTEMGNFGWNNSD